MTKRFTPPQEGDSMIVFDWVKQLEECTVVEVNTVGLWYRVRFKKTGFHECYKVPRLKTLYGEADDQKGT